MSMLLLFMVVPVVVVIQPPWPMGCIGGCDCDCGGRIGWPDMETTAEYYDDDDDDEYYDDE